MGVSETEKYLLWYNGPQMKWKSAWRSWVASLLFATETFMDMHRCVDTYHMQGTLYNYPYDYYHKCIWWYMEAMLHCNTLKLLKRSSCYCWRCIDLNAGGKNNVICFHFSCSGTAHSSAEGCRNNTMVDLGNKACNHCFSCCRFHTFLQQTKALIIIATPHNNS